MIICSRATTAVVKQENNCKKKKTGGSERKYNTEFLCGYGWWLMTMKQWFW